MQFCIYVFITVNSKLIIITSKIIYKSVIKFKLFKNTNHKLTSLKNPIFFFFVFHIVITINISKNY